MAVTATIVGGKTGHVEITDLTDVTELPAVPGSFADLPAVRTYLLSLVAALNDSDLFEPAS